MLQYVSEVIGTEKNDKSDKLEGTNEGCNMSSTSSAENYVCKVNAANIEQDEFIGSSFTSLGIIVCTDTFVTD